MSTGVQGAALRALAFPGSALVLSGNRSASDDISAKLEILTQKVDGLQQSAAPDGEGGEGSEDEVELPPEEGTPEHLESLASQMFNMMEQDENDEIDLAEAAAFIKRAGIIKMSPEEVAAKYDEDQNGKISIDEFLVIVKELFASGSLGDMESEGGEEEEDKTQNFWQKLRHPIFPDSVMGFRVTFITMLFVLYSAFLIPARLGFNSESRAGPLSNTFDFASEFWFMLDIYLSFKMGYTDPDTQELVMDLDAIKANYLHGWFTLDFISSLPVQTATLVYPNMSTFGFLKVFRLCKLFRLVKLLKLKALEDLEDSGAVSPSMIRLCKITFTFCLLMHMTACCFWMIVRQTCVVCTEETQDMYWADCGSPYTRTSQPAFTTPDFCPSVWRVQGMSQYTGQVTEAEAPSLRDAYFFSFYWSIMAMLGDNSAPASNTQFVFSIFMSMIGIVVFSTIIGALSALLSSMDKLGEAKQEQLDSINQYMAFRRVDRALQLRIRAYYKYLWESGQSGHHQQLFDELPPSLSFQLTLSLKEELVVSVPMFRRCPPKTVLALVKLLKSLIAIPEESIIREGARANRMYFCLRGKLEVVINTPNGEDEIQVTGLASGDFFGEASMFNPNATAGATVRTVMHCELEVLSFVQLRQLMATDKALTTEIKKAARGNFVRMQNAASNAAATTPAASLYADASRKVTADRRNMLEKSLLKKYKKDAEKVTMMASLHSAAHNAGGKVGSKKITPS
jgi:CRP-like cAMP-binding protein